MDLITLQTAAKTMEQTPTILQKSQQDGQSDKISIYKPNKVDAENFAHGVRRLKAAFPKLPNDWFDLLDELIDDENWSNDKFKDAVMHLIKSCVYPEPTIANFLSYDKTVKTYTYEEVLEHNSKFMGSMKNFKTLKSGKWIRKEDADKYGME